MTDHGEMKHILLHVVHPLEDPLSAGWTAVRALLDRGTCAVLVLR